MKDPSQKQRNPSRPFSPLKNYTPKSTNLNDKLYSYIQENLPRTSSIKNNSLIVNRMQAIVKDLKDEMKNEGIFAKTITPFGSQLTGLALADSDIDMTLLTHNDEANLVARTLYEILLNKDDGYFRKFGFYEIYDIKLRYHPIHDMHFITLSNLRTIENPKIVQSIDITINAEEEIKEALVLRKLIQISPALKNLILLIKLWAARFRRHLRMNTFAYCIMAVHFLQNVISPRVLPPFDPTKIESMGLEKYLSLENTKKDDLYMFRRNELRSPEISDLLCEFFKYYGVTYHDEAEEKEIRIEIKGNKPKDFFQEESAFLFDIVSPFGKRNVAADFLLRSNAGGRHKRDMKMAYKILEAKGDLFAELDHHEKNKRERKRKRFLKKLEKSGMGNDQDNSVDLEQKFQIYEEQRKNERKMKHGERRRNKRQLEDFKRFSAVIDEKENLLVPSEGDSEFSEDEFEFAVKSREADSEIDLINNSNKAKKPSSGMLFSHAEEELAKADRRRQKSNYYKNKYGKKHNKNGESGNATENDQFNSLHQVPKKDLAMLNKSRFLFNFSKVIKILTK